MNFFLWVRTLANYLRQMLASFQKGVVLYHTILYGIFVFIFWMNLSFSSVHLKM